MSSEKSQENLQGTSESKHTSLFSQRNSFHMHMSRKNDFPVHRHKQSRPRPLITRFKQPCPKWWKCLWNKESSVDTGLSSLYHYSPRAFINYILCSTSILPSCEHLWNIAPSDKNDFNAKCKLVVYLESNTRLFANWPYSEIDLWPYAF